MSFPDRGFMFQLDRWIRPIYSFRPGESGAVPQKYCGTGFVLPGGIFITCRHCVEPLLEQPEFYAGAIETTAGRYKGEVLNDLCFESSGMDLAAARVATQDSGLMLGINSPGIGQEVGTFGYAGTIGRLPDGKVIGNLSFEQQERWHQGYVTRAYDYQLPSGEVRPSWEVDMPTPGGLSGAPLIHLRSNSPNGRGVVIGVCYGRHLAHGEADTSGIPLPGYVFGLAHYYSSLQNSRFDVLGDATLGEFLDSRGAIFDMSA